VVAQALPYPYDHYSRRDHYFGGIERRATATHASQTLLPPRDFWAIPVVGAVLKTVQDIFHRSRDV
jgi:hypothetical protein